MFSSLHLLCGNKNHTELQSFSFWTSFVLKNGGTGSSGFIFVDRQDDRNRFNLELLHGIWKRSHPIYSDIQNGDCLFIELTKAAIYPCDVKQNADILCTNYYSQQ